MRQQAQLMPQQHAIIVNVFANVFEQSMLGMIMTDQIYLHAIKLSLHG